MLKVQEYLKSGKTFEDLTAELGIVVKKHDSLPLAILNYDQIESPKTHPIVRECRALVLHSETFEIVARSFPRFYNWGEVQEEMTDFDFNDFSVQSKEDGSLVILYHFDGQWHANTRGSFATDQIATGVNMTWREAFCVAMGIKSLTELDSVLDPHLTYVCEFCSIYNKVVRRYEKPTMFLLTAFSKLNEWQECPIKHCDWMVQVLGETTPPLPQLFQRPTRYDFKNIDEITKYIQDNSTDDPTYEGVVIRDKDGRRWKVKSAVYLGLHKLRGEGDNLFNPKRLLPYVLAEAKSDDLLTYYPEVAEAYFELKAKVQGWYIKVLELWATYHYVEDQKEFALAVKDQTPFASVLFSVRKKYGKEQTVAHLKQEWLDSEDVIAKRL